MEELLDGVEADVEVEVAVELAVEVGDVAPSQFKESQVTNPKIVIPFKADVNLHLCRADCTPVLKLTAQLNFFYL
jgi:hypothetical protein